MNDLKILEVWLSGLRQQSTKLSGLMKAPWVRIPPLPPVIVIICRRYIGSVLEWSNRLVLKTRGSKGSVGSNPTASAKIEGSYKIVSNELLLK